MRLRELLARPDLRLRLLHGDADALERPLRWVYTTDLLDPGRYLSSGELVVSGLVWRSDPADSEVFVAALARAGAAALAAGEAVFGRVPDDVRDACVRHGVPLLAVPEEVSFGAVTEVVVGQVSAARGDRLALSLGRQRRLLSAVAGGLGLDELAGQVSADAGRTCRVLTAAGAVVAGPPLPASDLDAVVAAFLTGGRAPGGRLLAPIATPGEPRLTSWFAAVDPLPPGTPDDDAAHDDPTDALAELCAFAALDRSRRDEGRRTALGLADDAVALLVGGAPRTEIAARLRQTGLDPAAPLLVVVARLGSTHPPGTARTVLAEAVAAAAPPEPGAADSPEAADSPGTTASGTASTRAAGSDSAGTTSTGRPSGARASGAAGSRANIRARPGAAGPTGAAGSGAAMPAGSRAAGPTGAAGSGAAMPAGSRAAGPTGAAGSRAATGPPGTIRSSGAAPWPVVVALHDGAAVTLLPAATGAEGVLTALRRLAPALPPGRAGPGPVAGLAVGVGHPSDLDALAGALQEARHACDLAALRAERVAVVTATELTSHVGLLAAVPDDVRRAFADRALGPLLAHDARVGTGLLPTLQAFLDCDGSWSRAAAQLHLHVNSVRYRIARVEQLTGRDLGTLADRTDLLLALTIRGR